MAALLPSLSLFFDSDLSSPGLICCCAKSLRYVDVLCLATWFVAIFPAHRSPACSRCASYCGFSSPIWCTTFAMGSHLRGQGCCDPRSERRFGLFLFPFWADSSRWNHPLGRHCFRSHSRSERSLFCISVGVVQDLHGGLPNSGFKLDVASVPVRPGGLIFCHFTTVLVLRSPSGSSVLVSSHFYTTGGCHYYLALYPSGWASSLYLRLLFAPCHCRRVSWWSSLRPRVFGNSSLSSVLPYPMIRLVHLHCT